MTLSKVATKKEAIAFAAGLAIGSGGGYAVVEDGRPVEQVVAPVEVGEGELSGQPDGKPEGKETVVGPDRDNDGVPDQKDMCPWSHGEESNGCPKVK